MVFFCMQEDCFPDLDDLFNVVPSPPTKEKTEPKNLNFQFQPPAQYLTILLN